MERLHTFGRVRRVSLFGGSAFGALIVSVLSQPAHAQTLPSEPARAQTLPSKPEPTTDQNEVALADQGQSLGDIVVTAQRRDERLLDVPVAVSAFGETTLARANISNLAELPQLDPSVSFTTGTIFPYAFVRGFGTGGANSLEQSVGKFVDQVGYSRDQDIRLPIYDVQQVQLLKGPQVLLYGNSATAGAVVLESRRPQREFSANISSSYEFLHQEATIEGGVTTPLNDAMSFRLAGFYNSVAKPDTVNLYLDSPRPTSETVGLRPWLRIEPAPGLEVDIHGEYDRIRVRGGSLQEITQPLNPNAIPYRLVGRGDEKYLAEGAAPFFTFDASGLENELYQADLRYDALGGLIQSTTAYRVTDSMSVLTLGPQDVPHFLTYTFQHYKQFSQELRYSASFGRLDLTSGVYYQRARHIVADAQGLNLAALGTTGLPATPFGYYRVNNSLATTWSAFAELSFRLTDALTISAGGRYTHNMKKGGIIRDAGSVPVDVDDFGDGLGVARPFVNPAFNAVASAVLGTSLADIPFGAIRTTEHYFQPQVVAQYKFGGQMLYAKYVRGDKAGGYDYAFSGTNPADAVFLPEEATSYEFGAKGKTLNGNFTYTLAIFRIDFKNLQTAVFNQTALVLKNVGAARSDGVELGFDYRVVPGLKVSGTVNYMNARYLSYVGAACNAIQNNIVPRGCSQDLSGAPTRFSAKWTGSLNLDYTATIGKFDLGTGASALGRSKYNAGDANDPGQVQPGYVQLGAYVSLGPVRGPWKATLFARNLTDQQVLMFGGNTPFNGTGRNSNLGPGRQIGVTLTLGN